MSIRQLQIAHDAVQDRLLLRVATQADEEFRVWLTRRLLRELWPHLSRLTSHPPQPLPPSDRGETTRSPAAAPHFEEPFRDDKATYPLGSSPLLTSEVKMDTHPDGTVHMTFREGRERSFELTLTADLLHAFLSMLRATTDQAQWDLALDYAPVASPPHFATTPHSRLH